jgi:putative glutamine amidotransferase
MPAVIAIPEPSVDAEYNQRSLPTYLEALKAAGAEARIVPLNAPQERVAQMLAGVQGILLPGSRFDVDPERYGEQPIAECGPADAARTEAELHTGVNHQPGRAVVEAHPVEVRAGSRLAGLLAQVGAEPGAAQVNSSHHQAIHVPGDQLRVTAVSPDDGVIEAVELDAPEHFVVAVQWHPERTYAESAFSRAIFQAFVQAAEGWDAPQIIDSVGDVGEEPKAEPAAGPLGRK